MGEVREPWEIDPRFQDAVDEVLNAPWPDEPEPYEWELRDTAACERPLASPPTLLVDIREAARILGCGRSLVYQFIRAKELPHLKLGQLTRIPVAALEEFVARRLAERRRESQRGWWEDLES